MKQAQYLPHRLMSLVPIRRASLSDSKAAEKLWPSAFDMFLKACFVRSRKTLPPKKMQEMQE
jgi:hypothetical protein